MTPEDDEARPRLSDWTITIREIPGDPGRLRGADAMMLQLISSIANPPLVKVEYEYDEHDDQEEGPASDWNISIVAELEHLNAVNQRIGAFLPRLEREGRVDIDVTVEGEVVPYEYRQEIADDLDEFE